MLNEAMERLRTGDIDSLDTIYELTRKLVFSICLSYVHDRMLAEDMMQNTYILIRKKINLFKTGTNASAWITTIAKNTCLNEIKARKKIEYYENIPNEEETYSEVSKSNDTPLLNIALKILKDKELFILLRHIVDEEKLIDIARDLHVPEGTIRWKYNNSLSKIRNHLNKNPL